MTQNPLLAHCPPTLPRAAYVGANWFAREQAAIWAREWVYVGRIDIFHPGTAHRLTIAGRSVLVLRQDVGIVAYHNVCRHRGTELCSADQTEVGKRISCPYHGWSYASADGRLLSTAFGTPTADFDGTAHGLMPVATQVWKGMVFLSLATNPPPFLPDAGIGALDSWPMDSLVLGHRTKRQLACNWKVFWENYNECLHCPGIHPELSARVPIYAKGIMSAAESQTPLDPSTRNLASGAQSWTMSGQPCGPVFPDLTPAESAEGHRFVTLYPSAFVVAHVDYIRIVGLHAVSPDETILTAEWLFHPDTLARPDFDLAHVTGFARTVMEQDAATYEMNQRGLRSPAYTCGTLMPQEFDVHQFHKWVLDRTAGQIETETP